MGIAKGTQGRHKEALDAFDESLRLNPKDANAWNNRGVALIILVDMRTRYTPTMKLSN